MRGAFPALQSLTAQPGVLITCSGGVSFGLGQVPCSRWGDFTSTYDDNINPSPLWSASQYMANATQWGAFIVSASAG